MPYTIVPIPAFADNYIWTIVHQRSRHAVIIDPGDADAVISAVDQLNLIPTYILVTHHHWDHTGGIDTLKSHYSLPIYGPDNPKIAGIDHTLGHNDKLNLPKLDLSFQVHTTPGHTLDHIVYVNEKWLFCGDTLFSAGCGRLFEGNAAQMYESLQSLARLPNDTAVYCTHEYTLSNLKFARTVEPDNSQAQDYFAEVQEKRAKKAPTLPSSIGIERQINPFLRCEIPEVHRAAENRAQKRLQTPTEVFAVLRCWKDTF